MTCAIRCFINRKRVRTSNLTKAQARTFCKAALHLAKYLKEAYFPFDKTINL